MEIVTAQQLRDGWRRYREAANFERKTFLVTYFDTPVAVVLPPDLWRRGVDRVPHGGQCWEVGVRESRVELRRLLDRARNGGHTVITKHGDENTVVVPYGWFVAALPELIDRQHPHQASRAATSRPAGPRGCRVDLGSCWWGG